MKISWGYPYLPGYTIIIRNNKILAEPATQQVEKSPQEEFSKLQQKIQQQQHQLLQQRTLHQTLGLLGKSAPRSNLQNLQRNPTVPTEPARNVVQNHLLTALQQHLLNRTQEKSANKFFFS